MSSAGIKWNHLSNGLIFGKNPFKEIVLELASPPNTQNDLIKGDNLNRNFSEKWPHCKSVFLHYKKIAAAETALPNNVL